MSSEARAARPEAAPARKSYLPDSIAWWRIASIVLFCLIWEIGGRSDFNFALPAFTDTAAAFIRMVADGSMLVAYGRTLQPLVIGIVISAGLGVGLGIMMGLRDEFEWFGAPLFIVMQAAPMAALIPLVTFTYGIGLTSKVLAVVILALPVIVLNSYKAVRNVNTSLVDMSRSFLGTQRQQVFKIILPDASPMIFAGLRLGVSAGFIGIVLAELLITPTGIGDLITYHRAVAEYPEMYATVASIIVFAAVTVTGLQALEVALFRPEKQRMEA